jgi:nucleotide-binding universal stress UspA family protein
MSPTRREVTEVRPDGGVVVGDDGSACAAVALREAVEQARVRGLPLHVVRAWSLTSAMRPADVPQGIVPSVFEFEEATLAAERERVGQLLAEAGQAELDVQVHVVHAPAAKALVAASAQADLLVVGTRGLGGFKHLLLGSVAEQCVRHAASSVLVVRG